MRSEKDLLRLQVCSHVQTLGQPCTHPCYMMMFPPEVPSSPAIKQPVSFPSRSTAAHSCTLHGVQQVSNRIGGLRSLFPYRTAPRVHGVRLGSTLGASELLPGGPSQGSCHVRDEGSAQDDANKKCKSMLAPNHCLEDALRYTEVSICTSLLELLRGCPKGIRRVPIQRFYYCTEWYGDRT